MTENALRDLLIHTMKDMYFAENAIYKALPKMIEGAKDQQLRAGLAQHREETKNQIARLEEMFAHLDMRPEAKPCKGMQGILSEGEEALQEFGAGQAGDAGVIASCQGVEHYEITRYGAMHAWATELGLEEIAEAIEETLAEEYAADEKLTALAESGVNERAGGAKRGRGAGGRAGRTGSRGASAGRQPRRSGPARKSAKSPGSRNGAGRTTRPKTAAKSSGGRATKRATPKQGARTARKATRSGSRPARGRSSGRK